MCLRGTPIYWVFPEIYRNIVKIVVEKYLSYWYNYISQRDEQKNQILYKYLEELPMPVRIAILGGPRCGKTT